MSPAEYYDADGETLVSVLACYHQREALRDFDLDAVLAVEMRDALLDGCALDAAELRAWWLARALEYVQQHDPDDDAADHDLAQICAAWLRCEEHRG